MATTDQAAGTNCRPATHAAAATEPNALAHIGAYITALDEIAIVTTTDTNGTILHVNDQCVRLTQYSRAELIGANYRMLSSGLHPAEFFRQMYRTIEAGQNWRGEIRNRAKDGSLYWVDTTIIPMRGADGRITGYFSVRLDISDRKRAEEALRAGEQRARELSDMVSDWYWAQDADLRFTAVSEGLLTTKVPPETVIGKQRWELPYLSDREAMQRHRAGVEAHLPFRDFEYGMPDPNGIGTQWFSISGNPVFGPDGRFAGYHGLGRSITARVQAEEALRRRTDLLQAIVDNFPGGISLIDDNLNVAMCNRRLREILNLPDHFFEHGPPRLEDLIRHNAQRGEFGSGDVEQQVAQRMAEARVAKQFEHERPDGTVLEARIVPLEQGGCLRIFTDVTERRRNEARIAHMARHDSLTGLPNRTLLRERMEAAMAQCAGQGFALLYLDIDRFKLVNDTFGHPAGDELLKTIAGRLCECVRDLDTVARLSGDEFAIVQVSATNPKEAAALAQRIAGIMNAPFDLAGHQMFVGVSIGIAMWPNDSENPDQLLKNADLALYRAKSEGRGTYRFFKPEMDARMRARRDLELDLREALARGEFELDYQPIVELPNYKVSGCEALLRWRHARRGRVSPAEFVPLAEETGLIVPIGEWVLRQACADAVRWPEHVRLAVNLSAVQFKGQNLVQTVFNALATSGLDAQRLELEITETVFLHDTEVVLSILHQLRALGVRIAMDDFGTGYSSLAYLQRFPFDKIKIDRAFIARLAEDDSSVAILRAIAGLGRSLGMTTTAEGVETLDQLRRVRDEGCSEVQGYLFSHPRSAEDLQQFLSRSGAGPVLEAQERRSA